MLRRVVEGYLRNKSVDLSPRHRVGNFATGLSLVASIRGVALLPAYVEPLLPWSVVSRPLRGEPLTVDLAVGYRPDNTSPVLKTFLAGFDQLSAAGPAGTRQPGNPTLRFRPELARLFSAASRKFRHSGQPARQRTLAIPNLANKRTDHVKKLDHRPRPSASEQRRQSSCLLERKWREWILG